MATQPKLAAHAATPTEDRTPDNVKLAIWSDAIQAVLDVLALVDRGGALTTQAGEIVGSAVAVLQPLRDDISDAQAAAFRQACAGVDFHAAREKVNRNVAAKLGAVRDNSSNGDASKGDEVAEVADAVKRRRSTMTMRAQTEVGIQRVKQRSAVPMDRDCVLLVLEMEDEPGNNESGTTSYWNRRIYCDAGEFAEELAAFLEERYRDRVAPALYEREFDDEGAEITYDDDDGQGDGDVADDASEGDEVDEVEAWVHPGADPALDDMTIDERIADRLRHARLQMGLTGADDEGVSVQVQLVRRGHKCLDGWLLMQQCIDRPADDVLAELKPVLYGEAVTA